jgi:pimeloyl-ACP methyl ester carboxylesterase
MKKNIVLLLLWCVTVFAQAQTTLTHLAGKAITCIAADTVHNCVWVGTNAQGLWRYDGTMWEKCPAMNYTTPTTVTGTMNFDNQRIQQIAVDANGGVWVAQSGAATGTCAGGGIDYLPDGFSSLTHYTAISHSNYSPASVNGGIPSANALTVAISPNNVVWTGHSYDYIFVTGMSVFDINTGTWLLNVPSQYLYHAGGLGMKTISTTGPFSDTSSTLPQGAPFDLNNSTGDTRKVIAIASGANEVWVARDRDVYGTTPPQIVRYNHDGTIKGVYHLGNTPVLPFGVGASKRPVALCFDTNGNGWCGVAGNSSNGWGGIAVLKDGVWSYLDNTNMPNVFPAGATVNTNAIWATDLGHVFIGTTNGFVLYDGQGDVTAESSYTHYPCISYQANILGGIIDGFGDLWFASNNGVYQQLNSMPLFTTIEAYNVKEDDSLNYYMAHHRLLNKTSIECSAVSVPVIKVAADGTKSTLFTLKSLEINTCNVRINSIGNTQPNEYGTVELLPSYSDDSIRFIYKHPNYKNATTPNQVVFEVYNIASNDVEFSFSVDIKAPPVLLLHGVNSDGAAMQDIKNGLLSTGFYENYQINNPNYPPFSTFASNTIGINGEKELLSIACLTNKLSFGKIDFVGHSMGGILSRLYLQSVNYKNDMHKLISINTPHAGSQAANAGFLLADALNMLGAIHPITRIFAFTSAIGIFSLSINSALGDLQTTSPAITVLLNGQGNLNANIAASHAITSIKISQNLANAGWDTNKMVFDILEAGNYRKIYFGNPNNPNNIAVDLLTSLYGGESDWIVSEVSQQGGLPPNAITGCGRPFQPTDIYCDLNHMAVEHNPVVVNRIKQLLSLPTSDNLFSFAGYNPHASKSHSNSDNSNFHKNNPNVVVSNTLSTMQITTPTTLGGTYNENTALNFTMTGSNDIQGVFFICAGAGDTLENSMIYRHLAANTNTLNSTYTIPLGKTGRINILALGFNSTNGLVAVDTFHFFVGNVPVATTHNQTTIKSSLSQNYPNPFATNTTIQFYLGETSKNVVLNIIDITGKIVQSYDRGNLAEGNYDINVATENISAGVYFYELKSDGFRAVKRMIIVK